MSQRPIDDVFGGEEPGDDDPLGRRDKRPRVSDFVRRAIENTVGSVQDKGSAPREALEYLLKQGDKGRRELFRIVAGEVGDFLKHVDLAGEVVKVLTSVQVEVNASLRFKPTDNVIGLVPTPDSSVSVSMHPPGEKVAEKRETVAPAPTPPPDET